MSAALYSNERPTVPSLSLPALSSPPFALPPRLPGINSARPGAGSCVGTFASLTSRPDEPSLGDINPVAISTSAIPTFLMPTIPRTPGPSPYAQSLAPPIEFRPGVRTPGSGLAPVTLVQTPYRSQRLVGFGGGLLVGQGNTIDAAVAVAAAAAAAADTHVHEVASRAHSTPLSSSLWRRSPATSRSSDSDSECDDATAKAAVAVSTNLIVSEEPAGGSKRLAARAQVHRSGAVSATPWRGSGAAGKARAERHLPPLRSASATRREEFKREEAKHEDSRHEPVCLKGGTVAHPGTCTSL